MSATMTNATTKSSFRATPKSDILCNTEVQHGSPPFLQSEISTFFATKIFCCKKCRNCCCKNGRLPCCTSMLHKMSDFGVARKLDFVVALVIVADNSPLFFFYFSIFPNSYPHFLIFEFETIKTQIETESEKNESIAQNSENELQARLKKVESNISLLVNQNVC